MSTICHHTISLDGYIAGPDDSMDWAFAHGRPTAVADETMNRLGAILAGRRWYELANERWNEATGPSSWSACLSARPRGSLICGSA